MEPEPSVPFVFYSSSSGSATAAAAAAAATQKRSRETEETGASAVAIQQPDPLLAPFELAKRHESSTVVGRVPQPGDIMLEYSVWHMFNVERVLGSGYEGTVLLCRLGGKQYALKVMRNEVGDIQTQRPKGYTETVMNIVLRRSAVPLPHLAHFYDWMRCRDPELAPRIAALVSAAPQDPRYTWAEYFVQRADTDGVLLLLFEYVGETAWLPFFGTLVRSRTAGMKYGEDKASATRPILQCALAQVYAQLDIIRAGVLPNFNHGDLAQNLMAVLEPDYDVYEYNLGLIDPDSDTEPLRLQVPLLATGGRRLVMIDLGHATGRYTTDEPRAKGAKPPRVSLLTADRPLDVGFWGRWGATLGSSVSLAVADEFYNVLFDRFGRVTAGVADQADERRFYRDRVLPHEFFAPLHVNPATGRAPIIDEYHKGTPISALRVRRIFAPLGQVARVQRVKDELDDGQE